MLNPAQMQDFLHLYSIQFLALLQYKKNPRCVLYRQSRALGGEIAICRVKKFLLFEFIFEPNECFNYCNDIYRHISMYLCCLYLRCRTVNNIL